MYAASARTRAASDIRAVGSLQTCVACGIDGVQRKTVFSAISLHNLDKLTEPQAYTATRFAPVLLGDPACSGLAGFTLHARGACESSFRARQNIKARASRG